MIALRAMFGQDEASHGATRYRVGRDGVVVVPREAAFALLKTGGFAAIPPNLIPTPIACRADLEISQEVADGLW